MKIAVDWRAALWAALLAGTVFLLITIFVMPLVIDANVWVMIRLLASIVLGEAILAPPATSHPTALVVALLVHYTLSLAFALLIAVILHRWGLLVGIVGGALCGAGLYVINIYSLSYFFPWFFALHGLPWLIAHILFGSVSGAVYEILEIDRDEVGG